MRTVYLEATTAAALEALARETGRSLEAVVREHVNVPTGSLTVHVVDLTTALLEQLQRAPTDGIKPWPALLEAALAQAGQASPEDAQQLKRRIDLD
jgi:hypothetical protein